MSTISLANKYRPRTLRELVHQKAITDILENQIKTKTFRNTALFIGPAGTGKTTSARAFAYELNEGKGLPIEVDAASNNGVDDVRDIIVKAQQKSLDSTYKVFIIDECFAPDTLISTANGVKQIKDIQVGDYIQNAVGYGKVTQVNCNRVLTNRVCCVKINGVETFTTVDHLYFTNNGWVPAKDLKPGDVVYANIQLQKLWKRVLQGENKSPIQFLFDDLSAGVSSENTTTDTTALDSNLSGMWERIFRNWKETYSKDMLGQMSSNFNVSEKQDVLSNSERSAAMSEIGIANENKQSELVTRSATKNAGDENKDRFISDVARCSWWQWAIYNAAAKALSGAEYAADIRICDTHETSEGQRISNVLQSRPRLSVNETCNRGGWQFAPLEKWLIERCKEDKFVKQSRVDSVTIYKPGDNDELFQSCINDKSVDDGQLLFYDLTVDNHPSYFANGTLVHNCHSLSTSAWQAFLKMLEEPPVNSVFILCTTDPQKIPATILSRVQRFEFQRIPFDDIVNRLKYVIGCENKEGAGITYTEEAIHLISKLADGGMRDALTRLDKVISFCKDITLDSVIKALGAVNYEIFFKLTNDIFDCKEAEVIKTIEETYRNGTDLKQFIKQYTAFLLDVGKYSLFKDFEYIQIPDTYKKDLDYTVEIDSKFLRYLLDEVNKLNSDIKWEVQVKPIIELKLLSLSREA